MAGALHSTSGLTRTTTVASALIISLATTTVAPASACSIFSFSHDGSTVFGQNLDWRERFPGSVVVNPRGIEKTVLPWKGDWPTSFEGEPVSWISRYGSVTFTCYGRDFIEGGMNEAGLTVDETSLTAVYPPVDDRPGISCAQWMQYQLDNYATVEEVLLHLGDLRPDGGGWHYLMADADGDCAVIEYPDGGPHVYTADAIQFCALTNTTYRQATSHIQMDKAFGGGLAIGAGDDSYGRFVRMALRMRDYDPELHGTPAEYAFRILDEMSCYETIRSVVYDAGERRVSWKTPGDPEVRWLDFAALDLRFEAPVMMLDVEAGGRGDAAALLMEYSTGANRAIVTGVKDAGQRSPDTVDELESRGLTYDEALELIATHPTSTGGPQ